MSVGAEEVPSWESSKATISSYISTEVGAQAACVLFAVLRRVAQGEPVKRYRALLDEIRLDMEDEYGVHGRKLGTYEYADLVPGNLLTQQEFARVVYDHFQYEASPAFTNAAPPFIDAAYFAADYFAEDENEEDEEEEADTEPSSPFHALWGMIQDRTTHEPDALDRLITRATRNRTATEAAQLMRVCVSDLAMNAIAERAGDQGNCNNMEDH